MFTRWILLFTLAISSWLLARASFVQTAKSNFVEKFTKSCPSDGIPVCAARGKDYFLLPNECWLDDVNAEDLFGLFGSLKKVPIIFCISSCHLNCPEVNEPICALNVKTQKLEMFRNMCELVKYACSTNMDFQQIPLQTCEQSSRKINLQRLTEVLPNSMKAIGKRSKKFKRIPVPCTGVYKPVCGIYKGVKSTFKNECLLNAENVKFGKDWRVIKYGICDEDYLSVRRNPNEKPQQGHSVRRRSYRHNPDYVNFHNRNADYTAPFKPDITLSSNDLLKYMPGLYQSQRDYANSVLSEHTANNIMQQILTLPEPTPDVSTSQEKITPVETQTHQPYIVANEKALQQYRTKNYNSFFNGIDSKPNGIHPTASLGFERRELLAPVSEVFESNKVLPEETESFKQNYDFTPASHALDINAYEEKSDHSGNSDNSDNGEDDYYFETYNVGFPSTTEPSKNFENIQRAYVSLPKTTTPLPKTTTDFDAIFVISRRTTAKNIAAKKMIATTKKSYIESTTKKSFTKMAINKSNIESTTKKSNICNFGNEPICGILTDGTVRTFKTICEMTDQNSYLKKGWVKLHTGCCETCESNCNRDYKPICVQRNGVNYTMVNECYYNMGICLDKRSNWTHIADGACKRFSRIPDKYENVQQGFQYTSKLFATPPPNVMTSTVPTSITELISTVEPSELTTNHGTTSTTKIASSSAKQPENHSTEDSQEEFSLEDEQSVSTTAPSKRRSRKRNKVSKRKIATHSRAAESINFKESEESFIMNLTKTKGGQNPST